MRIVVIFFVFSAVHSGCCKLQNHSVIKRVDDIRISSGCVSSLKLFRERLNDTQDEDIWALQMLDSSSKMPVGLLSYNFGEMGHFKQCTEIYSRRDNIKGKYCLGNIIINGSITRDHSFEKIYLNHLVSKLSGGVQMVGSPTWAICLPTNCTDIDAIYVMNTSQPFGIGISAISCQTIEDVNPKISRDALIGITILSFLLLIVMASTSYDLYCQGTAKVTPHPILTIFSAYTNGKNLFKIPTRSSNLACLDGIRVLSMMWIVLLHTYSLYTAGPIFNSKDIVNLSDSLLSMVLINGGLACDTFLLIGGILVTYVFFKKEKYDSFTIFSIPKHYFHRYIRLAPSLAGVVLVSATLLRYMGSGPKWPFIVNYFEILCKKHWWSALLFVQNQVHVDQMCAGHSWYLNVDMQLFLFSPLIFWILMKYSKTGIFLLTLAAFSSISLSFYRSIENELAAIMTNYYSKTPSDLYMNDYYVKTETRAAPWFLGTILGYILSKNQLVDVKLSKKVLYPTWIITFGVIYLCVFGGHSTLRGPEYSKIQNALYIAFVRPSFAVAVGWIIWACASNHGGILNIILSLPLFRFLNKFIYSMYLLHVTTLFMIVYSSKTSNYFSLFNVAYWFWGIFMLMFGLSIVWVLMFETPMLALEKILFPNSDSKEPKKNQLNEKV